MNVLVDPLLLEPSSDLYLIFSGSTVVQIKIKIFNITLFWQINGDQIIG
jgi:hypothetical protein